LDYVNERRCGGAKDMSYLKFAIEVVGVLISSALFVMLLPAVTALVAMACLAWLVWATVRLLRQRTKPTDTSTARILPS
jgi:heme/copper-type cytochrome/quinol oxidase subunit 1